MSLSDFDVVSEESVRVRIFKEYIKALKVSVSRVGVALVRCAQVSVCMANYSCHPPELLFRMSVLKELT